jgi:hypothetical protein
MWWDKISKMVIFNLVVSGLVVVSWLDEASMMDLFVVKLSPVSGM